MNNHQQIMDKLKQKIGLLYTCLTQGHNWAYVATETPRQETKLCLTCNKTKTTYAPTHNKNHKHQ